MQRLKVLKENNNNNWMKRVYFNHVKIHNNHFYNKTKVHNF